MSTDPREFEHPIDGTGGTVTPEAIEAVARALRRSDIEKRAVVVWPLDTYKESATAALSAAYPLMEAQVKAEAWDEGCRVGKAHGYNVFTPTPCPTNPYRAATIESGAPNV